MRNTPHKFGSFMMVDAMKHQEKWKKEYLLLILSALLIFITLPVVAQAETKDLTNMSIEDLMDVEITSVAKKEQSIRTAPAAVFVLTNEDIRRSTAQTLSEALRMVPGLTVARVDGNRFSIGARGSSGVFADKLLVLIDGRTVYNQIFSGVYWDVNDVVLEDIERIEVIRGPGATVWGANAVNGVINVITKKATDTKDGFVSGGWGAEEPGFASGHYGYDFGSTGAARVYGKYLNRDDTQNTTEGQESYNGLEFAMGGARSDLKLGDYDVMSQVEYYNAEPQTVIEKYDPTTGGLDPLKQSTNANGGHFLTKATRSFADGSQLSLQFYYDHTYRTDPIQKSRVDTIDFDSNYRFKPWQSHDITVGATFRRGDDDLRTKEIVFFDPQARDINLFGAFVQDEITLSKELIFTGGLKVEHHDFVGMQFQPSARLLWTPTNTDSFWTSVARAAKIPSRANNDMKLDVGAGPGPDGPVQYQVWGNTHYKAIELTAYEAGYKKQLSESVSADLALFYNTLQQDATTTELPPEMGFRSGTPVTILPLLQTNEGRTEVFGGEFVMNWLASDKLRFQGWYSYSDMRNHVSQESGPSSSNEEVGRYPHGQWMIRGLYQVASNWTLDGNIRMIDSVPSFDVDRYTTLNLRLGWSITPKIELSANGENLLQAQHKEYASDPIVVPVSEIERSFFGKITVKF